MTGGKTALIVFAREPRDGKIKTRLCDGLPVPMVTRLYKEFVKDVLRVARNVRCDRRFLYVAGKPASGFFTIAAGKTFILRRQTGKDLGERIRNAFTHCYKNGFQRVVIIGTDCLTLTSMEIERAFQQLSQHDCVAGPSKDGGYYLIGLNTLVPELFDKIPWGTDKVLARTLEKAGQKKLKTRLLAVRRDIDTIGDLKKFYGSGRGRVTAPLTWKILGPTARRLGWT